MLLVSLNAQYVHTSLSIRQLRAYCAGEFDVTIAEYTVNDRFYDILSELFLRREAVVGFSCHVWNVELSLKLADALKRAYPDTFVVFGGPEVSHDACALLRKHGFIDCVISGEGEAPLLALLRALRSGGGLNGVPSLTYRADGGIAENPPCDSLPLSRLPFAYEDLAAISKPRIAYYESSRGCPFCCGFCLSAGVPVRYRPLDETLRDLKYFANQNIYQLKLIDRTFNADISRANAIWRGIAGWDTETNFHFEIDAELLNEESLSAIAAAPPGRFQFEIGVQSTHPPTLRAVGRRQDFAKLSANVRALMSRGNARVHLDLIAGLPYEGPDEFKKSYADAFALRSDALQIGFLKFLKGSRLRAEAASFSGIFADFPPYEVLRTGALPPECIYEIKLLEAGQQAFYHSPRAKNAVNYLLRSMSAYDLFVALGRGVMGRKLSREGYAASFAAAFPREDVKALLAYDWLLHDGSAPPDLLNVRRASNAGIKNVWRFGCDVVRLAQSGEYLPGPALFAFHSGEAHAYSKGDIDEADRTAY